MTKIKEARLALGITATEAARRIGISRQRYSLYERGTNEANYEMLLRIAEAFGVTVDWLLNRESAPAELRRSALVGRVMSLSDDQVSVLSALLDQVAAESVRAATERIAAGLNAPAAQEGAPLEEVRKIPKSEKCG